MEVPDYIGMDGRQRPIRHANEFWDHYGIDIDHEHSLPADLIFFSRNGTFPTHIGILLDDEHYIHSPGKKDTVIRTNKVYDIKQPKLDPTKGRITHSRNPIGFKAPVFTDPEASYRYHQTAIR